jgi:hypothetical protein
LTVECDTDGTTPDTIYVEPAEGNTCANTEPTLHTNGPFGLGHHVVQVFDQATADAGEGLLCEAELEVVDTTAPETLARNPMLWPPNHSWRTISVDDCFEVSDRCDSHVSATVLWADSDEPFDDVGDGNTEPDVRFLGCDLVQLRAERQGPGDGRVYRIGWLLLDDSGNQSEAICEVAVPHDQGNRTRGAAGQAVVTLENAPSCQTAPPQDAGCATDAGDAVEVTDAGSMSNPNP